MHVRATGLGASKMAKGKVVLASIVEAGQAALEDTSNLRRDSESDSDQELDCQPKVIDLCRHGGSKPDSDKDLDRKPKAIDLCRDGGVTRSQPSTKTQCC